MEYIYIFRSYTKDISLLKFGYTSDIWLRLSQYRTANPGIEIVYIAQLSNAFELEQIFHKQHSSVHGNEWYSEDKLVAMMDYLNSITHTKYNYEPKVTIKLTLKDVVEEYQKGDSDYVAWAIEKYDFLEDAIQYLGYDKIKEYDYSQTRIKRALLAFSDRSKEVTIKSLLEEYGLTTGVSTPNERLKVIFSEIYTKLGINKTPKAIDLEYYFNVKPHTKIINKIRYNGLIIL